MRRRRIPLPLLVIGLALSIGIGVAAYLVRPALGPDMVLEARFGNVVWNHEMHARMKDIANCQVCHHQERAGVSDPRPCRDCHRPRNNRDDVVLAAFHGLEEEAPEYGGDHGPPPMTAYHGRCVGCHTAMQAGPVGCRDCHAQEFSGAHGVVRWDHHAHARRYEIPGAGTLHDRCVSCHHQDGEARAEGDYRACDVCHEPAAVSGLELATGTKSHEKAKHGDCARCHLVRNPELDRRTCHDCHGGWTVGAGGEGDSLAALTVAGPGPAGEGDSLAALAVEKPRPPLEQAVHQKCTECHRADFVGIPDEDHFPVACNECHEPDPSLLADLDVGLVLWDHDRHARYGEGVTCTKCHHADADVEQPHMACNRCHGTGLYDNPPVAEALRKRCLGCHEEKENGLLSWSAVATDRENVNVYVYEGPDGSFAWNHRDHAVSWSFSCRNCHHGILRKEDGTSVTAAVATAAWTGEAERIQACSNCHGEAGPVEGSPAAGSQAPSYDDAYRKVCLECHVQLGGGPQTWEDYFRPEPVNPDRGS
ncbi:MAG TPA: cytochrome c3 family protein [bacterium]|nr:cytochrome c3 family protein [bacterium]